MYCYINMVIHKWTIHLCIISMQMYQAVINNLRKSNSTYSKQIPVELHIKSYIKCRTDLLYHNSLWLWLKTSNVLYKSSNTNSVILYLSINLRMWSIILSKAVLKLWPGPRSIALATHYIACNTCTADNLALCKRF